MDSRKEMKQRAKRAVKKHYAMYLVICLIAVLLGTEFSGSLEFSKISPADGNPAFISTSKGLTDVINALLEGKNQKALKYSKKIRQEQLEYFQDENTVFGRTRGIFAEIVNSVTSGSCLIMLLSGMSALFGSPAITIRILLILCLLAAALFWMFLIVPYAVVSRRFFLEGRIYRRLPAQRFLFLSRTGTWINVSWVMLRKNLFLFFWSFTLIGGVIKRYSYFLVPYLAAENPEIKAKDAIWLSRKMMKGHKWQCFLLELSMILWKIPDILTAGLSAVLFTNAYRTAVFCEYYAQLRKEALEKELPKADLLNDYYLYETADDKLLQPLYRDVLAAFQENENFVDERHGFSRFLADTFGIILVRTAAVQKYEAYKSRQVQLASYQYILQKDTYPLRLSSIYTKERPLSQRPLYYIRCYTLCSLILIYFILAFAGWLWEVSLTLLSSGTLVNRGVLHGPWLPIYGTGSILILTLLNKLRKNPVLEFICTIVLCGILEYLISVYLEAVYQGQRWWDYTGYFLNIHGRICAEGLLLFGVGGLAVVYLAAPLIDSLVQKIRPRFLIPLCIALVALFCADQVYSARYPNASEEAAGQTAALNPSRDSGQMSKNIHVPSYLR